MNNPPLPPRNTGPPNPNTQANQPNALELKIASTVGTSIGATARNQQYQKAVGNKVGEAIESEENQERIGETISQKTDNKYVIKAAQNKNIQKGIGKVLGFTARNEVVQKTVGNEIGRQAEDEKNQTRFIQGAKSSMNEDQSQKYYQTSNFASDNLTKLGYLQNNQPHPDEEPPELPPKLPPKNRNNNSNNFPNSDEVPPPVPSKNKNPSSSNISSSFPSIKPSIKPVGKTIGKPSIPSSSNQIFCLNCGAQNKGTKICTSCGKPFQQQNNENQISQGPSIFSRPQGPPVPSRSQGPPVPSRSSSNLNNSYNFSNNSLNNSNFNNVNLQSSLKIFNVALYILENGNQKETLENGIFEETSNGLFFLINANQKVLLNSFQKATPVYSLKEKHYLFFETRKFYYIQFDKNISKQVLQQLDYLLENKTSFFGSEQEQNKKALEKGLVSATVIQNYQAQNENECSLQTGQTVLIREFPSPSNPHYTLIQSSTFVFYIPNNFINQNTSETHETIDKVSKTIEKSGKVVGKGLKQGGVLFGTGVKKLSEKAAEGKPKQEQFVTEQEKKDWEQRNKTAENISGGISKVGLGVGKAASFIGKGASNLYKNSSYAQNQEEKKKEGQQGSNTQSSASKLGGATFGAFGSVINGGSDMVVESSKGVRDARVGYVDKTRGQQASELEKRKWDTSGEAVTGGYKGVMLMETGVVDFATSVAVEGIVGDETPEFCVGNPYYQCQGEFKGWAVEIWHKRFLELKPKALVLYGISEGTEKKKEKPDFYVSIASILEIKYPLKPLDNKHPFAFGIKLRNQIISLNVSQSDKETKVWIDAILNIKKAVDIAGVGKYY